MPDSRAFHEAPRDWSDAFAALPLETPPAGNWETVRRRLPAARRTRRPYWVAIAAALALAAVIPVSRWGKQEIPSAPGPLAAAPSLPIAAAPDPTPAATTAATGQPPPAAPASAAEGSPAPTAPRTARVSRAGAASPVKPRDSDAAAHAPAAMEASHASLETLYAESARLEAVLAQLPEPRVASAAAAALSAELQDRIADIDSALSEPGMPSASQLDLWQQRVDALRQLTGMETTQRWMAAQGAATEGPWTQVY